MKSFVGNTIEICIATRDHKHTIEGILRFGIGPWKTYTFNPENTTNQTYRGKPSPFTMKVCFAQTQNIAYEIIQPISGPNIFDEFLDKHGEGVHHIAFDCNGIPWEERVAGFKERGFQVAQSGSWEGKCHFAYLDSEDATTTCFETILFEEGGRIL
ncbi:Glyoxalase/Bleomycin resistance protein/Dioxygenase superfamily-domain-containing protein [Talaromyces proteolyticus]|uniref:Glyoxalase/Bleomycin resistance protein/Dioxygenase superfamily-domain-containing protein n=1 Tax=Talaromyces proteolyticus TaxID=1131652 RepID=A0AAD4KWP9_9EURO|nr:Glyoxalase/Bleomycin resistance protein/Dioxygenase superfamily-domain-containing protein [Talaromyces proteolyticus]KAH8698583.1 Glyoxalase/Bleomycin resistance protein/Dioxygenase superfamily-domain-containing protein [Talaromyces proteolyticus]